MGDDAPVLRLEQLRRFDAPALDVDEMDRRAAAWLWGIRAVAPSGAYQTVCHPAAHRQRGSATRLEVLDGDRCQRHDCRDFGVCAIASDAAGNARDHQPDGRPGTTTGRGCHGERDEHQDHRHAQCLSGIKPDAISYAGGSFDTTASMEMAGPVLDDAGLSGDLFCGIGEFF